MYKITRRDLLKILLVLSTPALFLTSIKGNSVGQSLIENENHISFEKFFWMSQMITKQNNLDEKTTRKIYRLIINEPYGPEHLRSVYQQVKLKQTESKGEQRIIIKPADFSAGEQWFISHLLLTWYTGVYYHDKGNHHVTLKHALMYKKISNFRTPPTYCAGAPGHWDGPPNTLA